MFKRILIIGTLAAGLCIPLAASSEAEAGIFGRRIAPARRAVARAVLPSYSVGYRAAPVYRSYYRPYGYSRPYSYGYGRPYGYGYGRAVYSPGVYIGVGF